VFKPQAMHDTLDIAYAAHDVKRFVRVVTQLSLFCC
jgi:hypothetical protein